MGVAAAACTGRQSGTSVNIDKIKNEHREREREIERTREESIENERPVRIKG